MSDEQSPGEDPFAVPAGESPIETLEDRDTALLTPSMREFLYDPTEYDEASRPTYRKRIRDRVRNGLLDFDYLRRLGVEDRQKILYDMKRTRRYSALRDSLQFLYTLAKTESSVDFEEALREAVFYGEYELDTLSEYEIERVDVSVDVKKRHVPNPEDALAKFEEGETLSDAEVGRLLRNTDRKDFPDAGEISEHVQNNTQ